MVENNSQILDIYMEQEILRRQGRVRLEEFERDPDARFIAFRQKKNFGKDVSTHIYEAFLSEDGKEECVRIADQNPLYIRRPRYSIRGVKGREKIYVSQAADTFLDGKFGKVNYGFYYQYQLSDQDSISIETNYKPGKKVGPLDSALISWQRQVGQKNIQGSLEFAPTGSNWHLRFEDAKSTPILLPENERFSLTDLRASFETRTQGGLHEFVYHPHNQAGLVFQFPHLIDTQDWDNKIRSIGRGWKVLVEQFPVNVH